MTRRAFLGLPPEDLTKSDDGEETNRNRSTQSADGESQSSRDRESLRHHVSRQISSLSLGFVVVLLVLAPLVGTASAGLGDSVATNVQPSEAIDSQERALTLLSELEGLDGKEGVDVSATVFGAIDDDLAQGNASYRENNYAEAKQHYDEAAQKARAALTRGYINRSELLLNGSSAYLQTLRDDGYQTSDMAVLAQRLDRLETRTQSVDSLSEARNLHADTVALKQDIESETPDKQTVSAVNFLHSIQGLALLAVVGLGTFGVGGVVGVVIDRYRRDDGDEPEDQRVNPVSDASGTAGQSHRDGHGRVHYED